MGLCVASCGDNMLQFRRCLAASFFLRVALKQPDGEYRVLTSDLANELVVQIHPSSVLSQKKPECIVFNELVETNDKRFICNTTRINYPWLSELAPPRLKKVLYVDLTIWESYCWPHNRNEIIGFCCFC
ncbi:putative RNA helicase [Rosa chinensis]|uniref:Putative RNA helicase n=1 Tax=Rosa chinensis TaxID=74649 RepID=A0A2P6PTM2_ROSCH|nr:putative RNA helicase [Rosa chinensis]